MNTPRWLYCSFWFLQLQWTLLWIPLFLPDSSRSSNRNSVGAFLSVVEASVLGGRGVRGGSSSGNSSGGRYISVDGRKSYSLSTFDTQGRLAQVDRAMEAASLGTPIVAAVLSGGSIVLAAPQYLPSMPPLMLDDGTSRFCFVTSQILVSHSGLSADGRVLTAAAQRLAVQHEYVFDEEIPIHLFLQELSLVLQEYTMKPGVRPFGVTLLVAYVPSSSVVPPQLFRVDASGAVLGLGSSFCIVNGPPTLDTPDLRQALMDLKSTTTATATATTDTRESESEAMMVHEQMASILRTALHKSRATKRFDTQQQHLFEPQAILTAVLSRTNGFSVERHEASI